MDGLYFGDEFCEGSRERWPMELVTHWPNFPLILLQNIVTKSSLMKYLSLSMWHPITIDIINVDPK